ncbi:TetR/AcrR family transcriptional regulator [Deinococcus roseus]|uniref:TetR family transcriptional regulator n=1 Tax=Deinococcus roseus TaxID=392414 RepID=A0ABQ2CVV2_9DEIO|nr:TetR/AcrR family transcriptional regulator [Deinococcus roseus]GGJ19142.1 TetR family transcriptional regulator [Deinococcus roseus]
MRNAREHILQTASQLFYQHGIRAVGVDTIIQESGVAKMTLYRHFPSKDDLMVAFLDRTHTFMMAWMEEQAAPHSQPRSKLEGIFVGVQNLTGSIQCLGCAFLNASAEFQDLNHPAHQQAIRHKEVLLDYFVQLATAAELQHPEVLAGNLLLLLDGAWAAARMFGPQNHASGVAQAARSLIAAHAMPVVSVITSD